MNLRPLWEGEAFLEKPINVDSLREASGAQAETTRVKVRWSPPRGAHRRLY